MSMSVSIRSRCLVTTRDRIRTAPRPCEYLSRHLASDGMMACRATSTFSAPRKPASMGTTFSTSGCTWSASSIPRATPELVRCSAGGPSAARAIRSPRRLVLDTSLTSTRPHPGARPLAQNLLPPYRVSGCPAAVPVHPTVHPVSAVRRCSTTAQSWVPGMPCPARSQSHWSRAVATTGAVLRDSGHGWGGGVGGDDLP